MADSTVIKYITLDNLDLFLDLEQARIDAGDAKALKTVALSTDGKKLLFYKVTEPVGSTPPAYEIELPETDLSGLMEKVVGALNGNVPVFENGTVKDSGIKLSDLASQDYVDQKVAEGIVGALSLKKEIVTSVPTASEAKENVIYLLKVETATGSDKYEEYMLISGTVQMIGDTSTDLSNYYTKEQAQAIVNTAKEEAIAAAASDATSKANQAVLDANAYTDQKVDALGKKVTANETAIAGVKEDITNINNNITTLGDRITSVETKVNSITTATEEDIRALFA